ncbi:MAG: phosphoribosylamine--glycine ligase, partial [Planctomycetota bacterium]|nr:phosphoribosylamine--glycine ligase [Planctomycetota bacterium]
PIRGLDAVKKMKKVVVFHAGTQTKNKETVTAGGRVLGVTASGANLREARERAYEAVGMLHFNDMHYRLDIAEKVV